MKLYHSAMEHCVPPEGLEERLRQRVLSAAPQTQRKHVFRPRGYVRKAVLAAVLAIILTVSAGAAVLLGWDKVFSRRFGEEAAQTPMGQAALQDVFVSSVCDDVTLTVRQALVSDKTIYLVLDYQLPDTVDRAWLQQIFEGENSWVSPPSVYYFATGEMTWEDLRAADQAKWEALDWADDSACSSYLISDNALYAYSFTGGASYQTESQGYDPETNTLTYLLSFTTESKTQTLTNQPLTLLMGPPAAEKSGSTATALADHPAILTFQPECANAQTLTGEVTGDRMRVRVVLSPFSMQVETYGCGFTEPVELLRGTTLVFRYGTTITADQLTTSLGGGAGASTSASGEKMIHSVNYTASFRDLVDVSQVDSVRVGGVTVPLE
ncbi:MULTISPECIES: hypothetical protein [environmental samples]|uniref:hypothetical protein n=1 Tax=environmental samples TaxID=876090 RepID=UPI00033ED3EE|nr:MULTISPECIES: hypothetical protein [environmental samples]CDC69172.1 unknown [Oscillibacter sp. CAG:155]